MNVSPVKASQVEQPPDSDDEDGRQRAAAIRAAALAKARDAAGARRRKIAASSGTTATVTGNPSNNQRVCPTMPLSSSTPLSGQASAGSRLSDPQVFLRKKSRCQLQFRSQQSRREEGSDHDLRDLFKKNAASYANERSRNRGQNDRFRITEHSNPKSDDEEEDMFL